MHFNRLVFKEYCLYLSFIVSSFTAYIGCKSSQQDKSQLSSVDVHSLQEGLDKKVFEENCLKKDRKFFVASSNTGIGNRLLGFAGAYTYALSTGRCLIFIWRENDELPLSYNDLFENDLNLIEFSGRSYTPAPSEHNHQLRSKLILSDEDWEALFTRSSVLKTQGGLHAFSTKESAKYFLGHFVTIPFILDIPEKKQIQSAKEFLRALKVTAELKSYMQTQLDRLPESFAGLHLRTLSVDIGDQFTPVKEDLFKLGEKVFKLQEELSMPLFVATDSPQLVQFLKESGNTEMLIFPSGPLNRKEREGIFQAITELYILSKAEMLYGTAGSTFSDVAALISKQGRKLSLGNAHIFSDAANLSFDDQGNPYLIERSLRNR